MIIRKKKNIGRYEFLEHKRKIKDLYKRLVSEEFDRMPFYKYAIALTSLLENQYYVNALIVGQAIRQNDITWLVRDFTVNLDFVAQDFSQFRLDPDLYKDVNLIETDFLTFTPDKQYDLIIVQQDLRDISKQIEDFMIALYKIAAPEAHVIFFLKYYDISKPELKPAISSEEILNFIPFKVRSKLELKNYQKGQIASIDLVIDSFKQ